MNNNKRTVATLFPQKNSVPIRQIVLCHVFAKNDKNISAITLENVLLYGTHNYGSTSRTLVPIVTLLP